jgi:hypothetical protein
MSQLNSSAPNKKTSARYATQMTTIKACLELQFFFEHLQNFKTNVSLANKADHGSGLASN